MGDFPGHELMPDCSLVERKGLNRIKKKKKSEEMKLIFRAKALSFLNSPRSPETLCLVSFAFPVSHKSYIKKLYLYMRFIPGEILLEVYI